MVNDLYRISTVFIVFFCSRAGSLIIDSQIQALAVGAINLQVSGYGFSAHDTIQFLSAIGPLNVTRGIETCVNNWCLTKLLFDPISPALLGTTLEAVFTNSSGIPSLPTPVAVVVSPPKIHAVMNTLNTFEKYIPVRGSGLANCTSALFFPSRIRGDIATYTSSNFAGLYISTLLDDSFIGVVLNASVYCNGAWSSIASLGTIKRAPVDSSSSITCDGDVLTGTTTVSCTISMNGKGYPAAGNSSSFHVYLTTNETGTITPFVMTSNTTLAFNFTSTDVHSPVTAQLYVLVNSSVYPPPFPTSSPCSDDSFPCEHHRYSSTTYNITGSPILFQIVPPAHHDKDLTTLAKLGIIIGAMGVIVIILSTLVGFYFASRPHREKYEALP